MYVKSKRAKGYKSGIILLDISDHFGTFICLTKEKEDKCIPRNTIIKKQRFFKEDICY